MGLRLFTAIFCLISLLVELGFDNTNSFVRVATASDNSSQALVELDLATQDDAIDVTRSLAPEVHQAKHGFSEGRSLGHVSVAVSSFVHVVVQLSTRIEPVYVRHFRDVERYSLLRPPILS